MAGHTQKDLANKLGCVNTTISEYERGKNQPDLYTLSKIADIYGWTVEDLLVDIGEVDLSINDISISEEYFKESVDIMYPIIKSPEALDNELFKKAYNRQMSIYEQLKRHKKVYTTDLQDVYDNYIKAWEDHKIYEAVVNILSIMFIACENISELNILKISKDLSLYHKLEKKQAKALFDRELKTIENSKKDRNSFVKEYYDDKTECLRILRNSKFVKWHRLAEYYIALSYVLNFTKNDNKVAQNQKTGWLLMEDYAELGNAYCKKFLKHAFSIYKKNP